MRCQTIKQDKECFFWAAAGCTHEDGKCHAVVEKCEGCGRLETWPTGKYCGIYALPEHHWSLGICNMATHIKIEAEETQKMLNPLKASKRASRGR